MAPKRQSNIDLMQIPLIEWARLAAFIDGEGTITTQAQTMNKGKCRTTKLSVQVSNTDIRIPLWCQRIFGGAVTSYRGASPIAKPYAVWTVASLMAEETLRFCLPYFVAKREQAEMALLYRGTFSKPGCTTTEQQLLERQKFAEELSRLKHELPEEGRVVLQ